MLGEWNFSKRAAVGGDWTFLLKMGRKPGIWGGNQELEGWFYNGGDGKFLKSLYIVGRGVCWPPIFWRPPSPLPPYIPNLSPFFKFSPTPFFKFSPTPPHPPHPCHHQPKSPLFFLLPCFFGWMDGHSTFDVIFNLMIIRIYTCPALLP